MGAWKYSLNEIFLKAISLSIFIHFLKLCTILIGEKSSFKWVPISPLDALFQKIYFPSLKIYQVKYQYQICFRASKIPSKAWVNNLVTWSIVISETIPPFNSLGEVIYLKNFSSFFFKVQDSTYWGLENYLKWNFYQIIVSIHKGHSFLIG